MVLILSQFPNIKTMVLYSGGSINRESLVYFCSDDLDLEQVTLAKCKDLVTTIDHYSNLYVQNLAFYICDLGLDPMTSVLKLNLDMVVTN